MTASDRSHTAARRRARLVLTTLLAAALALPPAAARAAAFATADGAAGRSELYREGQQQLAEGRWDAAIAAFDKLAAQGGEETDAALYWKAYAQAKASRAVDALSTLRHLLATYPKSAWSDDARALELDLRGPGELLARPVPPVPPVLPVPPKAPKPPKEPRAPRDRDRERGEPELSENDALKLYALDGLMQVEPERAVPVLERFLSADHPLKLKKRALFVLSQSDTPRAREILLRTARSGEPLELRVEAVRTLGIAGDREDLGMLGVIFREPSPTEVRAAVLEAYMIAGEAEPLAAAARAEADSRLRGKAIEMLGAIGATDQLAALWSSEKEPRLRAKLLEAFAVSGNVEALVRAARSETDPALRAKAIEGLGIAGGSEAGRELLTIYRSAAEKRDKEKVLQALMIRGDARMLLELLRAEQDPGLKKSIIQYLAMLDSPEAEEAIFELLEDKP
jgi:hypothetical protein